VGLGVAIGCDVDEKIYITDQENMMALMEQNIKLNDLEARVVPLVLNWYISLPYPLNYSNNSQGRSITQRSHRAKAQRHPSRRLRVLRGQSFLT